MSAHRTILFGFKQTSMDVFHARIGWNSTFTGFAEGARRQAGFVRLCQRRKSYESLVFDQAAKLAILLPTHLANTLPRRRELKILAHHGSQPSNVEKTRSATLTQRAMPY